MKYLGIGDGLCLRNGAYFMSPSNIQRHARLAEAHLKERVYVKTIAQANYRSKDILALFNDDSVQREVQESNMILLSSGHQDFLDARQGYQQDKNERKLYETYRKCKSNADDIINHIKHLKSKQNDPYRLVLLGMHNPFQEDPLAEKWIKHYNDYLECRASNSNICALNLHHHFKNKLDTWCTEDYLFPNQEGHNEIAQQLHSLGYEPFTSKIN